MVGPNNPLFCLNFIYKVCSLKALRPASKNWMIKSFTYFCLGCVSPKKTYNQRYQKLKFCKKKYHVPCQNFVWEYGEWQKTDSCNWTCEREGAQIVRDLVNKEKERRVSQLGLQLLVITVVIAEIHWWHCGLAVEKVVVLTFGFTLKKRKNSRLVIILASTQSPCYYLDTIIEQNLLEKFNRRQKLRTRVIRIQFCHANETSSE